MIRAWLQLAFGWPCDHDWELLERFDVNQAYFSGKTRTVPAWIYRCKKCCKAKQVKP